MNTSDFKNKFDELHLYERKKWFFDRDYTEKNIKYDWIDFGILEHTF